MSRFSTTHWSVILQAQSGDEARVRQAVEHVCQRYWYPLYAYARWKGYSPADAEDAVQNFFVHLLEKDLIRKVNPEAGLFRNFLLTALKNHLISAQKREGRIKRGGGVKMMSLDACAGEERFCAEPRDGRTPEALFERSWAMNLIGEALSLLEAEYQQSGHQELFGQLQKALVPDARPPTYSEMAGELGISEGAVKISAHRMRRRYREILHGLIASTVSNPAEVRREMRHLLTILS